MKLNYLQANNGLQQLIEGKFYIYNPTYLHVHILIVTKNDTQTLE